MEILTTKHMSRDEECCHGLPGRPDDEKGEKKP